jgi:hypothetical protein
VTPLGSSLGHLSILALFTNMKINTNALAFYDAQLIAAVKSFMEQATGNIKADFRPKKSVVDVIKSFFYEIS